MKGFFSINNITTEPIIIVYFDSISTKQNFSFSSKIVQVDNKRCLVFSYFGYSKMKIQIPGFLKAFQ